MILRHLVYIVATQCPFIFPMSVLEKNLCFPLPRNVSEFNKAVCGNLGKGTFCGRCINSTGPSIYSVGIECVYRSPVNILYYLLLQHPWPTMFCFLFCQLTVTFTKYFIRIHTELSVHTPQTWSSQCLQCGVLTPCSSSSFFISPRLCLSKHMEEMYLPFLISLVSGSAFSCY